MPKWFRPLISSALLLAAGLSAAPVWAQVATLPEAAAADADDRRFRLRLAPEIADSGLMAHVLPRFALKTGRRAELTDAPDRDAEIGPAGDADAPVLARGDARFALRLMTHDADAIAFRDWLGSVPGQAAVSGFIPADGLPFIALAPAAATVEIGFDGDREIGQKVARTHCARCHVTAPGDHGGIGSTPSFMALRALPDWDARFTAFFARNPHPSFLRVAGVSLPFDSSRPPPVVPIEITSDELAAVQAYAAGLTPADLGARVEAR